MPEGRRQRPGRQLVELAGLLADCEPVVSHSYGALCALCADFKEQVNAEPAMAQLLVRFANLAVSSEDRVFKTGPNSASLHFLLEKPSTRQS